MNKDKNIFTVNDTVLYKNKEYVISRFETLNNILLVGLVNLTHLVNLKDIEHISDEYKILETRISNNLQQVIWKIKRLSDGEVFTVGDEISHYGEYKKNEFSTRNYILEKIYFIEENRLAFYVGKGLNLSIKNISKKKKPLLTTDFEVIDWENDKENFHIGDTILSVRRKSDNVTFKIGDYIKEGRIINIIIKNSKIYLDIK